LGIYVVVLGIDLKVLGIDLGVLGIDLGVLGIYLIVLGIDLVVLGINLIVLGIDLGVLGIDLVATRALALVACNTAIMNMCSYSVSYDLGQTLNRVHQTRFMLCSLAQPI
jgi:hypothetical protein